MIENQDQLKQLLVSWCRKLHTHISVLFLIQDEQRKIYRKEKEAHIFEYEVGASMESIHVTVARLSILDLRSVPLTICFQFKPCRLGNG